MLIEEIYRTLHELGLVHSQMEFSRIWLGRSARYYSSLLARQHQPAVGTLTSLLFRLRNISAHINELGARPAIFMLIQRLEAEVILMSISSHALHRGLGKTAISARSPKHAL